MTKKIPQRVRFYMAVEGEGEQSFIKLLQKFSDEARLHVHLDCQILSGGGYKTMLNKAITCRKKKNRDTAKSSILLLDADRAEQSDDDWSLHGLREEAKKHKFHVCFQYPNQEGLLLRMLPGNENLKPNASNANKLLLKEWPTYEKPIDAYTLFAKFTSEDLRRVAKVDAETESLLSIIGLR